MLECHTKSAPLISAIHFAIEQESNFQPQNDVLKVTVKQITGTLVIRNLITITHK